MGKKIINIFVVEKCFIVLGLSPLILDPIKETPDNENTPGKHVLVTH